MSRNRRSIPSASRTPRRELEIRAMLSRLFLVGVVLVVIGAIGELILTILAWTGYAMVGFVIAAIIARFVLGGWPVWVVRPCLKLRSWV